MTIQQHASFDSSAAELNATSKLVKAWESKNAKNAAKAGGISMMALSLAACGGSSTTTAVTPVVDTPAVDTPVVPVVDAAEVLKFTASLDTLSGGSGDDTFSGVYYADGGTGTTAFPGDSVDGGTGTDSLTISVAGTSTAAQAINAITTAGVEKVFISNYDVNADDTEDTQVDTSLMSGFTTVGLSSSNATGDTEFTNVKNIVDVEMRNGAGDLTISYLTATVAGVADSAAVTVSNVSAGALVSNGIETININTELAKSTITTLTSDSLTKLVVTGDQNLTITNAVDFVAGANDDTTIDATIDASDFTGKLNVTADQNDTAITGGSGDDTINMVGFLTSNDAIDGGAGDDTLTMNEAALTTQLAGVSNIETVSFNADATSSAAVTFDASKLGSTVKTIKFDADDHGGAGNDHIVSNITDQAIVIGNEADNAANGNTKVTLTNKTDTAADTLSVTVVEAVEDSDESDIDVLTAANFETVNLVSSKLATTTGSIINNIDSVAIASATTLNISGNSELVIDSITGGAMTALDASGLTGKLTATFASTDKVTATAASSDTTFNFGSTLDNNDSVIGGASAKDEVTATLTGATATTGALNISAIETVTLTTSGNNTLDLTNVVGATTVSVSGNTQTITGLNIATTGLQSTGGTTAKVTAGDATGAADVLTYGVKVNADSSNTVEASDIETLSITLNDTSAGTDHTATFDVDTFKGANIVVADVATTTDDMNVQLGTLNAAIRSVDMTGVDGTQAATAANASAGVSFALAGDAAATITGSALADTFTIASTTAAHGITGGTGTDVGTVTTKGDTDLSGIDVETLNLVIASGTDASVTNFHAGVDDVVVTGGNSLSTMTSGTLNTALKSLDASAFGGNVVLTLGDDTADNTVTLKGGSSTKDSLAFQLSDTDFAAITTGIETLTANVDADVDVINLTSTSGVTTVSVDIADSITAIVSGITTQTVKVTDGAGDSQIEVKLASSTGAADAVTVELKDAASAIDAAFNIKATDIETVTIKASSAESVDLSNLSMATATEVMSLSVTGDKALTVSALNADVTTVDASGMAEGGSFVQTGRSATTASTYTGTDGADTFIHMNAGDVISGGAGANDTLDINKAAILGGANVDLSSTTSQLVSYNGSTPAGTVKGFENVDLSGYTGSNGVEVTGSTGANKVTGSTNADQVTLGAGDDIYVLDDMTDDTVDAGAGTADALAMVAGVDVAVSDDMGTYTNFEKLTADAASTTAYSFTAKADFKTDTGISTIDFSADTNATGTNVIDLGAIDATMTVTGSSGRDDITLSDEDFDMTVTGGAGNDVIISTAAANTDTIVFASTGALNGLDTIKGVAGAGKDKLDVSAFLSGGTFNTTKVLVAGTDDIAIDNKVVMLDGTTAGDLDEIAEIAALIEGGSDALSLASGGKGIVLAGDASGANDIMNIYFVDDTVGAVAGTISADDTVKVGTFVTTGGTAVDLDTFVAANFVF